MIPKILKTETKKINEVVAFNERQKSSKPAAGLVVARRGSSLTSRPSNKQTTQTAENLIKR